MNLDEFNRRQREANFPANERVSIQGANALPGPDGQTLIKIDVLDHKKSMASLHMTVPNAMFLFALLRQLQADLNADVPFSPPD